MDWGLLATFAAFFTFSGNMARIETVRVFFQQLLAHSAMLVSALTSQIISNVPAAILLSRFTDDYRGLLVGVNVGGAGTLVPITGFSNAVTSPALDFKSEGFVTGMAAKMFTVAGPVITFGTLASVIYGVILMLLK